MKTSIQQPKNDIDEFLQDIDAALITGDIRSDWNVLSKRTKLQLLEFESSINTLDEAIEVIKQIRGLYRQGRSPFANQ